MNSYENDGLNFLFFMSPFKVTQENLSIFFALWLLQPVGCDHYHKNTSPYEPCTCTAIRMNLLSAWRGHKDAMEDLQKFQVTIKQNNVVHGSWTVPGECAQQKSVHSKTHQKLVVLKFTNFCSVALMSTIAKKKVSLHSSFSFLDVTYFNRAAEIGHALICPQIFN